MSCLKSSSLVYPPNLNNRYYQSGLCEQNSRNYLEDNQNVFMAIGYIRPNPNCGIKTLTMHAWIEDAQSQIYEVSFPKEQLHTTNAMTGYYSLTMSK